MTNRAELKRDVRHLILDLRQMKSFCEDPLIVASAEGIYLTDIDGKRIIDGISGIYTVNIGHGNERVIEAIHKQQKRISFVAPLHAVADVTVEYAKRLTQVTPNGLNTMKLLCGGSEAIETAIKFTRQYHRQTGNPYKYKFISLHGSFHGGTMGGLSATGLGGPRRSVFGPYLDGFVKIPPPTCYRCPYELRYPSCNLLCAHMLNSFVEKEGPESVAGFIVEPIGNTGGIVDPPPEYLPTIREICDRHNILLIFDEIITGFGRTGEWFAAQTFKTIPDLLCMGKGMGSGYAPLAGVAIRDDLYYRAFWGEDEANIHFAHGHTFAGNPISAAAGLAALEVIDGDNLIANGRKVGQHLRTELARRITDLGILGDVRGKGCLAGVEFVQDMDSKNPFGPQRMFGKCVERRMINAGMLARCDPDWIAIAPPLITTFQQADEMIEIVVQCVAAELQGRT